MKQVRLLSVVAIAVYFLTFSMPIGAQRNEHTPPKPTGGPIGTSVGGQQIKPDLTGQSDTGGGGDQGDQGGQPGQGGQGNQGGQGPGQGGGQGVQGPVQGGQGVQAPYSPPAPQTSATDIGELGLFAAALIGVGAYFGTRRWVKPRHRE